MDLAKAVNSGYSAEQVLEFLVSSFPYLGRKLRQASQLGHDAKSIISAFQGVSKQKLKDLDDKARSSRDINFNPIVQGQEATRQSSGLGQIQETASNLKNIGLATGGALLAGRALQNVPKMAQQVGGLLSRRGLPQTPTQTTEAQSPEVMAEAAQALPETAPAESGIVPQKVSSQQIIEQMGFQDKIKTMLGAKNSPEVISKFIKGSLTPGQKSWLKNQTDQPIEQIVGDYIQGPTSEKAAPKMAILPDGRMGEITGEKQGISEVALPDGKIARRKLSELDVEPPELAKQINDLITALPEEEKSRVLSFASYNPRVDFTFEGKKHNMPMMGVQFHNGDFYMYPGVSKEQFDKVVSKAVRAKTSGENEWGIWSKGEESRGAGMHELIKELEKEFGKNFIKFKASEGYDFWKRVRKELKEYFLRKKRDRT